MKNISFWYNRGIFFYFIITLLFYSFTLQAQQQEVIQKGKVIDYAGIGLPGVHVTVKNTTLGTSTDLNGEFSIQVPRNSILVFSFIGMKTVEREADSYQYMEILLDEDGIWMEEVIAVGYGSMRKSDITGSIASVQLKDVAERPNGSLEQMLQGKVAGVQISSGFGAKPGAEMSVRIRGTNSINTNASPLYVIDGIAGVGDLSTINPYDIESMEILKDASATAIYGARGANGVILITTKQGEENKFRISFDGYAGAQSVLKKMDLLDATEFAYYSNAVRKADGLEPLFEHPEMFGKGTDWQDEIFRTAAVQNYQLSLSGGNRDTKYYFSGSYFSQDGVVSGSGMRRGSARLNLDSKLTDWLTFGVNLSGSEYYLDNDNSNAVVIANMTSPIAPVQYEDGTWGSNATVAKEYGGPFYGSGNPVAMTQYDNFRRKTHILANAFFEISFTKDLALKTSVGMDMSHGKSYYYVKDGYPTSNTAFSVGGNASLSSTRFVAWQNENTLTYKKRINQIHQLDIMGGISFRKSDSETMSASAQDFVDDYFKYNNLSLGQTQNPSSSSYTGTALNSYFLRLNYVLKDKYLFTFTSRADGSSKFGEGNKYGFFPSGAVAYRMSQEPFIENIQQISNLKIRASAGATGNQEISAYRALAQMDGNTYVLNGDRVVGINPTTVANPNLRWEKTAQYDIGLDMGLFNERLSFVFDLYYKKTTDLLMSREIPYTSGFATSYQNIGAVSNKGVEFTLNTQNIQTRDFSWSTSLNISANRNKVLDLGGVDEIITTVTRAGNLLRVGQPMGVFYDYVAIGIWQEGEDIANSAQPDAVPGDIKYKNLNPEEDNIINQDDRDIVGNPHPKFIYGIGNTFRWKNMDLTVFIDGTYGNDVMTEWYIDIKLPNGTTNTLRDMYYNAWTPENPSATHQRLGSSLDPRSSSYHIEDGSFLRIKNVTLGYNLEPKLLKKLKLEKLRVYMNIENLHVFTKYSGYDPQANRFGDDNQRLGYDRNWYPQARTITGGISITY
ncbi:MAG: TonB-dependent receptor [Tannerellaceae bacterium]|nr:TonB-dependent receptor [Tannerellaceae bacterium]